MAKRALKPEIEPKPKRPKRPRSLTFKLTTIDGRKVWKSLQGDAIVTLPIEATLPALLKYSVSGVTEGERVRLIFEPWED